MSRENLPEILEKLQSDDQAVLKSLFQEHYLSVCKGIYRFVKDKSTTEDIAQDVFIKFWEKRKQLNITSSVVAYLHRMGTNEAISYLRRRKHFESEEVIEYSVPNNLVSGESEMLQSELQENVTDAINSLPPKCRAIFQLSRFEDLTYKEIAAKLDISVKTVENQMGKALRVLRGKLRGYLTMFF
jgi:RNA polymerase sigma-70 factor (ECF subfamily)